MSAAVLQRCVALRASRLVDPLSLRTRRAHNCTLRTFASSRPSKTDAGTPSKGPSADPELTPADMVSDLLKAPGLASPSKEWSQELAQELVDTKQLWQRGELWFVAQTAGILLLVLPPHQLRTLIDAGGGTLALVAGLGLMLAGQQSLGDSLTPLPKPRDNSQLATGGAYKYVRHPMYGGVLLAGTGLALLTGDALRLVLALALGVILDRKASFEEGLLEERYGQEYADLRARTKKLIPWIY